MGFEYLTTVPLDKAKEDYINLLISNGMDHKTEKISVMESCGRITANAVYAHICAPHYHACAMDGIALNAKVTFGAGETTPVTLTTDMFTVVDTGDPLPASCDAVVMIEDVIYDDNGNVKLYKAAAPWQHIRQIGEDICAGEMILPSFTEISPSAIGAMIAGGILEVEVVKKPVIGIIPTGDEIVPPCTDPKEGDILEFNSSIFSSMLKKWGADTVTFPIVKDNLELITVALAEASEKCDAVILNAGSSAGREDYSRQAISAVGEVLYHGIAIKPGKPAILGCKGEKPLLGVPGYPVSGIIVIEQILKPIVERMCRTVSEKSEYETATLSKSVVSTLKYQEFVRVRMGCVNGKLIASPLSRGSGVVSSFMKADGIMEVPQGTEGYEAGEQVTVKLLRPKSELQNTLVAIGSHDPLLDELSDILKRTFPDVFMSSSHVGSMGGIMAVRRGETHAAGVHLLDEATGTYNTAFINKYFPNGGVRLVECVQRSQGLMLPKGNPKGIYTIEDLARDGISYVNRQKGSGTRILCDYLCKKSGLDTSRIYGYDREEFTHTAVAALIATGSADAGMGIYSAAKLYDLDFVHICDEQYDLLIPDYAWELDSVQKLLEVLRSDTFKNKLLELGGYGVHNPGTVRQHF